MTLLLNSDLICKQHLIAMLAHYYHIMILLLNLVEQSLVAMSCREQDVSVDAQSWTPTGHLLKSVSHPTKMALRGLELQPEAHH